MADTPTSAQQADNDPADNRFYRRVFAVLALGCLAYCFCATFIKVPTENQRYADYILGSLIGAAFMTLIAWKWGGSHKDLTTAPPSPIASSGAAALSAELSKGKS